MSTELIHFEIPDALEKVGPALKDILHLIVAEASNMAVVDQSSFLRITALYSDSKDWEKRLEYARKQANQPDQERINTRNDIAKELLTPLKDIQSIAKKKCEKYQLILEQQKVVEQTKLEQAADILGLEDVPVPQALEKTQRGDGALMYTRTVRKFRIVDLQKVPLKYLQVNEDLVKQDVSLGVSEIEGIEVYEEKITQLKTR